MTFSFSSRWFNRGAFSLLNRMIIVLFGFQNVYFMVRLMPKSDIGVWALFISVVSILELLRNGFIRNPMITHLVSAHTDEERGIVITASWVLHVMLVIVTSLIMVICAIPLANFWQAPELDTLFYIYIVRGIILIPCLQFEYLQQGQLNFKAIFMGNLARLLPTGIYLLYKFIEVVILKQGAPPTLVDISITQVIGAAVSLFVSYIYLKGITIIYPKIDWKTVIGLSHFGKYTLGTTLSSMLIKNTDSG